MKEKVILSGEVVEGGIFKKKTKPIQLTKTKLVVGEKEYPIEEIIEAFNDYDGFTGGSRLGIRLKNGETLSFYMYYKPDTGAKLQFFLMGDNINMMMGLKNIVDKWVNAINTLKTLEQ